jgi:hypothetical protein
MNTYEHFLQVFILKSLEVHIIAETTLPARINIGRLGALGRYLTGRKAAASRRTPNGVIYKGIVLNSYGRVKENSYRAEGDAGEGAAIECVVVARARRDSVKGARATPRSVKMAAM